MLIDKDRLHAFLAGVGGDHEIFAPYREGEYIHLAAFDANREMALAGCRPTQPLKSLLYSAREQILPLSTSKPKEKIIVGVTNCDLAALSILDRALLQQPDFVDPAYRRQRESIYILAFDCVDPLPTCHCDLVDLKPYPENGFDLSFSPVGNGFYLTIGSDKGARLAESMGSFLSPSDDTESQREMKERRAATMVRLNEQNITYRKYYSDYAEVGCEQWSEASDACVECGACNNICPTCYCMVLNDESGPEGGFKKVRSWDSCQQTGYARVAGGATPRPRLWQRFRQRYRCKFHVMQKNFGMLGCTGCGRCITACPAGIDLREVVIKTRVV